MYDRVLFPTDGSEGSAAATAHAMELARRFDAPVHVLYVVDVRVGNTGDVYAGSTLDALREAGEEVVAGVRERAEEAGLEATSAVTEGTPASAIVAAAEAGDVIVMGTHGRTGLDRFLIGSTTEKVVRTADVPVVTVPLAASDPEEGS